MNIDRDKCHDGKRRAWKGIMEGEALAKSREHTETVMHCRAPVLCTSLATTSQPGQLLRLPERSNAVGLGFPQGDSYTEPVTPSSVAPNLG